MTDRARFHISLLRRALVLLLVVGAAHGCKLKQDDDDQDHDRDSNTRDDAGAAGEGGQSGRGGAGSGGAGGRDAGDVHDEDAGDLDGGADSCASASSAHPDSDGDGEPDPCDADDDGDGFLDADDPLPLDAAVPGNFSTPESILADHRVRAALEAAAAKGFPLGMSTARTPPDISGYWLIPDGQGEFVATGDGRGIGVKRVGTELRRRVDAELVSQVVGVSFSGSNETSYTIGVGNIVRGEGSSFTEYSRYKIVCNESGSDFAMFGVGLLSGSVEQTTGNLFDVRLLTVTVATAGMLTNACATRFSGDTEQVAGWSLAAIPVVERRTVAQLEHLCVDGENAYAPTESWTSADGKRCSCGTDYEKVCE
jgi:hypothetical protein